MTDLCVSSVMSSLPRIASAHPLTRSPDQRHPLASTPQALVQRLSPTSGLLSSTLFRALGGHLSPLTAGQAGTSGAAPLPAIWDITASAAFAQSEAPWQRSQDRQLPGEMLKGTDLCSTPCETFFRFQSSGKWREVVDAQDHQ